ncbi:MAG: translation initiation factor IF-2 N-terminal domain-containing protein [Fusobacterium gastrosuis]|uniref:translation initiation factor IF-2 N-terminal domain-containing protein n=1 Tax=Fusobacterium gastrosuis TaxID=1755100 RepID=UPI002974F6EA|nr:translation initiation factor IF-2 N-terminal domain-containing protein [Fusobacteriaceae bacterium]MDY4011025.1 translation initiation factor IF-2 N-terminal domain-containing protein [Fusobacterium gastrosuis]MDY5714143.1 translation initiation factor IF-2 N-terminal domain-containing protein [Fusobacterium gastrosuis]
MKKTRVYEINNLYDIPNSEFIKILKNDLNILVKTNFSIVTEEEKILIIEYMDNRYANLRITKNETKEDKKIKKRNEIRKKMNKLKDEEKKIIAKQFYKLHKAINKFTKKNSNNPNYQEKIEKIIEFIKEL